MSWTARATIEEVSPGPAPVAVRAVARASDSAMVGHVTIPGVSLAEGEAPIRSVEVLITFDHDDPGLRPGDVIVVSGRDDL